MCELRNTNLALNSLKIGDNQITWSNTDQADNFPPPTPSSDQHIKIIMKNLLIGD